MASPHRAVVTPRATTGQEWDDQVAELFEEGLLIEALESALYVVAGIIAAEPDVCQPRRRRTELAPPAGSRPRHTVVHPRLL